MKNSRCYPLSPFHPNLHPSFQAEALSGSFLYRVSRKLTSLPRKDHLGAGRQRGRLRMYVEYPSSCTRSAFPSIPATPDFSAAQATGVA